LDAMRYLAAIAGPPQVGKRRRLRYAGYLEAISKLGFSFEIKKYPHLKNLGHRSRLLLSRPQGRQRSGRKDFFEMASTLLRARRY
jgi:hypothetical protein